MSLAMTYDIDEFEELMAQSRQGGRETPRLRMCRSLPSSPIHSPKRSPEVESKNIQMAFNLEKELINIMSEDSKDISVYNNHLCPPVSFQETQLLVDGVSGGSGARPKVATMSTKQPIEKVAPATVPLSSGMRRTQSCRRPTTIKRHEPNPFSIRLRAHDNAWKKHNASSLDNDDMEEEMEMDEENLENQDPHRQDEPLPQQPQNDDDDDDLQDCKIYRVRSFRTTNTGIVNKGDSFKVKSHRQSSRRRTNRGRRPSTDTNDSLSSMSRENISTDSPVRYPKPQSPVRAHSPETPRHHQALLPLHETPKHGEAVCPFNNNLPSHIEEEPLRYQNDGQGPSSGHEQLVYLPEGEAEPGIELMDDDSDDEVDDNEDESPVFKVLVLGVAGVGKRTLTRQLLTSEYLANTDRYLDEDQEKVKNISVMLDDEESMLQFVDVQGFQEAKLMEDVDAYIIVYSVTDRNSFAYANSCLLDLTRKGAPSRKKVMILVANKQDIVRNRDVSESEGRRLAANRHTKYTEVSALLDHKVDELLVGIIRQIRLKQSKQNHSFKKKTAGAEGEHGKIGCLQKAALDLFRRIFRKRNSSKNCDNLLT